jgi:8-oxo-dGTP diphosphatase
MHNNKLPVSVHIFLEKDGSILLIRRQNTGQYDNMWSVPAGRLDAGESISGTALREAREEAGIEIEALNLGEPLIMHHKDERGERLYCFFLCMVWKGNPINMEPEKCSRIGWFDIKVLPDDLLVHVKLAYEKLKEGKKYIEYGF